MAGGLTQQFLEERAMPSYQFKHCSRTFVVTLAIATEIDVHYSLGYREDALYLWRIFSDYAEEAKEMFGHRYEKLLDSYS